MLGQPLRHHQEVPEGPPAEEQAERREDVERGKGIPADGEADGIVADSEMASKKDAWPESGGHCDDAGRADEEREQEAAERAWRGCSRRESDPEGREGATDRPDEAEFSLMMRVERLVAISLRT
jgi:hypothetical protein